MEKAAETGHENAMMGGPVGWDETKAPSKSLVLLFILTFCVSYDSLATVDYRAVNKITKEIYSFDQEQLRGIFWVSIGENSDAQYLALGFTYTKNPYTLDNLLTIMITGVSVIVLFLLWRSKIIKRSVLIILVYLHLILALKYVALYSYRDAFGMSVSMIMLLIPAVILLIERMIENVKTRRYSLALHVFFTAMFSYLLLLQMWIR
jgi:hypothetical protein